MKRKENQRKKKQVKKINSKGNRERKGKNK